MIQVAQLTDTHLFASPDGALYGVNTRASLGAVINHANANLPALDLLLVTGDLVHDETEQGYRALRKSIDGLGVPAYYLPGNHDDPAVMQEVLPNMTQLGINLVEQDNWLIVLLDSSIRGRVEGELSRSVLEKLLDCLQSNRHKHVIIALHHHVIKIHSAWLDGLNLRNNGEFLELLNSFSNVKAVLNGHIHQEFDETRKGVRFLGTPSTCFQFKPRQLTAGIDSAPAGYRHIVLRDDGGVDTRVYYAG
ncbi:MAG: 3',5'-cyclic-AMP phosphodiesterase [Gammaproteobacteria bacterium]|nr:3',5'-cyclic-AMP phosphodiesterase [Gammaproteobacteria bacterium]